MGLFESRLWGKAKYAVKGSVCILLSAIFIKAFWGWDWGWTPDLSFNVIKAGFIFLMLASLCIAVWRIELLAEDFIRGGHRAGSLPYAVYFTVSILLLFNPADQAKMQIRRFPRMIGAALVNGIDVTKRIGSFMWWFFLFAVFFLLFYLLTCYCRGRVEGTGQAAVKNYMDQAVVLADVLLGLRCITYFQDVSAANSVFYYSSHLMALIMLAGILYIIFRLDKKIAAGNYLKLLVCAFSISYPAAVLAMAWLDGNMLVVVQAVLLAAVIFMVFFLPVNWQADSVVRVLNAGSAVLVIFPFITSFYIELVHILNQHSIFVTHISFYYAIVSAVLVCFTAVAVYIGRKKSIRDKNWKSWSYGWLVLGISCLSVQMPFQAVYNADMFESASYSILISDFLDYGSIPFVEHYGAHMLTSVLEGLAYALLNGDFSGAVFSPYGAYQIVPLAVLFYIFVKYVWDEDMALWTALLLPFYNFWSYFGMGMLVCVAVVAYIRKHTRSRAFGVCLAFVWCSLMRLDLGYAFGIACVVSLAIYAFAEKDKKVGQQLLPALAVTGTAGGILWLVLCLGKGINPIERLLEFIKISASNPVWAYGGIGETGNAVFSWCYLFMPLSVEAALLYTVFSKKFRERVGSIKWSVLLIFGISYFANFPRAIVRHSLVEMFVTGIVWTGYLFLAVFISGLEKKEKLFVPAFTVFMLCSTLFLQDGSYAEVSIADNAASKMGYLIDSWEKSADDGSADTYWEALEKNKTVVDRVVWDGSLAARVKPYQTIMDLLLDEDETFIDLMNRSFLYSGIRRKNPAYVVQSPLLVSDEFTQELFLKEVRSTPVVILPVIESDLNTVLDGVANVYRYYKISEFIYEHYQPLCSGGEFAVWCLAERYDEMKQKLENVKVQTYDSFSEWENASVNNCSIKNHQDGSATITSEGSEPFIDGLQDLLDLEPYEGLNMKLAVEYESSADGVMQICYATADEPYSVDKSESREITASGTAEFTVPVTKNMKMRIYIPDGCVIRMKSVNTRLYVPDISWGYDAGSIVNDGAGNEVFAYNGSFHNYNLSQLPFIWAEYDEKKAIGNTQLAVLNQTETCYILDGSAFLADKGEGNYLCLTADYTEENPGSNSGVENEMANAVIRLGTYEAGKFNEKYKYTFSVCEGVHSYLLRVSSDYYWYADNINAVSIECEQALSDVHMEILQGD